LGIIFAFLSGASFALNNIFIKKGMKDQGSEASGFFLSILVNVALLGVLFLFSWAIRGRALHFSWIAFLFFVLAGIFSTALGRFTLFASIRFLGPSRASAIKNGSPMFTVLFALILLGETINKGPAIGMTLMLGGVLLQAIIVYRKQTKFKDQTMSDQEKAEKKHEVYGFLLGVLSAIAFGIGQGFRKEGLDFMNDAFLGSWLGAVTSLIFVCVYEGMRGQLVPIIQRTFSVYNPYYLLSGVLSGLGPLFFFLGSSLTQVSYVSVVAASEPLLTVLFSALFMKNVEKLSLSVWATVILVITGTAVMILRT
jgi:drug/metabolite transporter (DMT)-like permease